VAMRLLHNMSYLFKGFLIGFAIAAPVGPIGVLCVRRTLADGRLIGFVSGLGAASADTFYSAVAAFGLTAVQNVLIRQQAWLHLIGGGFLIYLGIRTFMTKPADRPAANAIGLGNVGAYLSTLGLTLTNPATIISFLGVFVVLRLGGTTGSYVPAGILVIGVFLGSAAWWLTLSFIVSLVQAKFSPTWMLRVNQIAGVVIAGFGLAALITL